MWMTGVAARSWPRHGAAVSSLRRRWNLGERTMIQVRTIFLSDVHLGIRACQAESLLEFLRAYSARELFLVGDIVDFQALGRSIYWTASHNTVVQKLLRRARHGECIVMIPGNHDNALREYTGARFGGIRVAREWIHVGADGKRYLLVH